MAEATEPVHRTPEPPRPVHGTATTPARRDRKAPRASVKAGQPAAVPTEEPASRPIPTWLDVAAYQRDVLERSVLFIDTLRQRADDLLAHQRSGKPPLVDFDYELILDARRFDQPANYALLRITRVADACLDDCLDSSKPPVIVLDPRTRHGPNIGGFKQESEVGLALREEILSIIENLFVGNRLEEGTLPICEHCFADLRRIHNPIVIFASYGDNITPPHQALGWIPVAYKDTDDPSGQGSGSSI